MQLNQQDAIELGQLIAEACHTLAYDQSKKFITIGDNIEDIDAKIHYYRAFREKFKQLVSPASSIG